MSKAPVMRGTGQPPRKYSLWEWARGYIALALTLPLFPVMWLLSGHKLPAWAVRKLLRSHERTTAGRAPDIRIPFDPAAATYMLRWWHIPRNPCLNCYYHIVQRSDDDRAHHDHPWWSFSIVLDGGYYEHRILAGGVHTKTWYGPGSMLFRWHGKIAHRLELATVAEINPLIPDEWQELPAKTIFITGPVLRRWGFHDSKRWVDAYEWDDYCAANNIASMPMAGYTEQLQKKD